MFLARNNLAQPVLIKLITAPFGRDTEFRRRLRIDLDHLRRLAPFCLAAILDLDTLARPPYVVVEYIDAPTLAASVEDDGPLHSADTARLAVGLAAALSALHGEGIVFGDLKPTNVVLSGQGLRLVDFGLARVLNAVPADNSGTSMAGIGTLAFISPEQALGQAVTAASDIFTWGGVLLFAATGHPPFGAGTPRALLQRAVYAEPDLSELDPELRELVAAAMRKDPKRRPRAVDLLEHLMVGAPEDDTWSGADHVMPWLPAVADAGAVAPMSRATSVTAGPPPTAGLVADEPGRGRRRGVQAMRCLTRRPRGQGRHRAPRARPVQRSYLDRSVPGSRPETRRPLSPAVRPPDPGAATRSRRARRRRRRTTADRIAGGCGACCRSVRRRHC
ncbi:serine/threonine-protein kinase [Frankia tisae]|uniref:serine/threonine-protein kinase n=1 Tax=Frankia tisae TaxID=2950104 RepID=UPI0021C06434|nr:serine/threonine-protein kinase [Frankia tisae]